MKNAIFVLVSALVLFSISCNQNQSNPPEESTEQHDHDHDSEANTAEATAKKPLSPRTSAMANIGDLHVHIDYSSPSVRGRTVWGGLVAYDQVWVTGAHKATSINFNKDVKVNGQSIPAGTYGFFTIPGQEEWVLILNKNYEQHLADDYDEALDVLRMKVKPENLEEPIEALTYEVTPIDNNKGTISVSWDQKKVAFVVEI